MTNPMQKLLKKAKRCWHDGYVKQALENADSACTLAKFPWDFAECAKIFNMIAEKEKTIQCAKKALSFDRIQNFIPDRLEILELFSELDYLKELYDSELRNIFKNPHSFAFLEDIEATTYKEDIVHNLSAVLHEFLSSTDEKPASKDEENQKFWSLLGFSLFLNHFDWRIEFTQATTLLYELATSWEEIFCILKLSKGENHIDLFEYFMDSPKTFEICENFDQALQIFEISGSKKANWLQETLKKVDNLFDLHTLFEESNKESNSKQKMKLISAKAIEICNTICSQVSETQKSSNFEFFMKKIPNFKSKSKKSKVHEVSDSEEEDEEEEESKRTVFNERGEEEILVDETDESIIFSICEATRSMDLMFETQELINVALKVFKCKNLNPAPLMDMCELLENPKKKKEKTKILQEKKDISLEICRKYEIDDGTASELDENPTITWINQLLINGLLNEAVYFTRKFVNDEMKKEADQRETKNIEILVTIFNKFSQNFDQIEPEISYLLEKWLQICKDLNDFIEFAQKGPQICKYQEFSTKIAIDAAKKAHKLAETSEDMLKVLELYCSLEKHNPDMKLKIPRIISHLLKKSNSSKDLLAATIFLTEKKYHEKAKLAARKAFDLAIDPTSILLFSPMNSSPQGPCFATGRLRNEIACNCLNFCKDLVFKKPNGTFEILFNFPDCPSIRSDRIMGNAILFSMFTQNNCHLIEEKNETLINDAIFLKLQELILFDDVAKKPELRIVEKLTEYMSWMFGFEKAVLALQIAGLEFEAKLAKRIGTEEISFCKPKQLKLTEETDLVFLGKPVFSKSVWDLNENFLEHAETESRAISDPKFKLVPRTIYGNCMTWVFNLKRKNQILFQENLKKSSSQNGNRFADVALFISS